MAKKERTGPIQQKDLAKMLNISTMTVSKALRGHPDVAINTRKRVQDLARRMDYRPNYVARNLSAKRTLTIGVIMPKIAHSFYSAVLDGIQTVAESKGYEIILTVSRESAEKEEKHFLSLISMRVDGLLLSVTQETVSARFEDIERMGIPLVFFDRALETKDYSSVKVDDRKGAELAVQHAINLGYKKIMHFAGYQNVDISRKRREGYLDALRKHQIPIENDMIIECGFGEQVGYKTFMEIYQKGNLPEVIFTVSDSVALGVYRAAKETHIRIGQDIGLIGFTDINVANILDPALTTIHEPAELMGKKAVNLLIEEIENKETREIQEIVLPAELKIRESCGEST
jgi:DNA-binding LacI/PurR family transcriptional regulator